MNEMSQAPAARLTDTQIAEVIGHLERAEENHRRWLRRLHRSLVCGGTFSQDVLDEQAHQQCLFGQWYYNNDLAMLRGHPEYLGLEVLHRTMHDRARAIAVQMMAGQDVAEHSYDGFMDHQQQFSELLLQLRDRLHEFLYSFDTLTGVMTREPFLNLLEAEAERCRRSGDLAVVALIDADHFKAVNDNFGHLVGDRVLRAIGQFLLRLLRRYDLLCRYGGEEFMVCLPGVGEDEAVTILDRLRRQLAEHDIDIDDGRVVRVTISVGLAALSPAQPIKHSIGLADSALYNAKAAGRNRVMSAGEG